MATEVFYRKWRPQRLADVVGQEPVVQTLRYAVEKGKVAHAYMFCGPRGTGKTSTGRILAKAVNCMNQVHGEPCNECQMCKSITDGKSLDIIEIDAASNRGIDEIRSLREKVNYAPGSARYKVYIIDEVHMLTEAASNALLKTLEEPPPQVIFVLATTEPQKVLSTIISRCQRFNFRRLSQAAIVGKLELICQEEGLQIGADSLKLVSRAATGSLRDAENMLQQLFSYYGSTIAWDQVQTALGISDDPRIMQLAKHIMERNISAGLKTICSVDSDGIDLRQFNQGLVQYLRGLLMVRCQCYEALDVTKEDLTAMKEVVTNADLEYLLRVIKLFSSMDFHWDGYSTLPLELTFVDSVLSPFDSRETGTAEALGDIKAVNSKYKTEKSSKGIVKGKTAYPERQLNQDTQKVDIDSDSNNTQTAMLKDVSEAKDIDVGLNSSKELDLTVRVASSLEGEGSTGICEVTEENQGIDYVRSRWKEFIHALRGEGSSGTLDAFLRSACELVSLKDNTLELGFYHSFHKEKIEEPKYRHLVEKKLKEVYNQPYKVKCILFDRKKSKSSLSKGQSAVIKVALEMGAELRDG